MKYNADGEDAWKAWLENNPDDYGKACFRYAKAWAELMETLIEAGMPLEQIAEKASFEADSEGITGFMYGMAVQILARTWLHGEELRRWNNLKYQLGKEGEAANEEPGACLNPAILSVGPKGGS